MGLSPPTNLGKVNWVSHLFISQISYWKYLFSSAESVYLIVPITQGELLNCMVLHSVMTYLGGKDSLMVENTIRYCVCVCVSVCVFV